jgi:hypothetical protein
MNEAYKLKDQLPMSFFLYDYEYYQEKAFSSWVEAESLDELEMDSEPSESNVSSRSETSLDDIINRVETELDLHFNK